MVITSVLSAAARRLDGKVALITGGVTGIGKSAVQTFMKHGAKVIIADVQDSLGHELCDSLGHTNLSYIHCDVTDETHVKNAIDKAVKEHGKLDIMFNNAGIADPSNVRIIDNEKSDFDRVLAVNVTGVFLGMKHAAKVMIPNRNGSIISTASLCSKLGGLASHAYTCSKHAVVGLTRNAAVELGQFGIRVNCLSPHGCATPLATSFIGINNEEFEKLVNDTANLKGVTLKPQDIADAALFLASDEARYISGQNLFIDGGFTIVNPSLNPSLGSSLYPDS